MLRLRLTRPFFNAWAPIDLKHATIYIQDGSSNVTGTNPTVNKPERADPVTAPTINVTGGGSTGGALQAGVYFINYTLLYPEGETGPATEATFTSSAGNIPRVTFPALPAGALSRNVYLTVAGGGTGTEKIYQSGIIALTTDLLTATTGTGAVLPTNNTGGYQVGAFNIAIDGVVGIFGTGSVFTISGDTESYEVMEHTETGGNTTSIKIAPALRVVLADNATLTLSPRKLSIKIGEGTFSYDEKRKFDYILDRGLLDTVREGNQEPVDVRLDFVWEFLSSITGSATPTIEEALQQTGAAASWVSSAQDPCEPYAVNLVIENAPPCPTIPREIITLNDFRYESLNHEAKQGVVSVTGKCNVTRAQKLRAL